MGVEYYGWLPQPGRSPRQVAVWGMKAEEMPSAAGDQAIHDLAVTITNRLAWLKRSHHLQHANGHVQMLYLDGPLSPCSVHLSPEGLTVRMNLSRIEKPWFHERIWECLYLLGHELGYIICNGDVDEILDMVRAEHDDEYRRYWT